MSEITDALLQRRRYDWYVGKALWVTGIRATERYPRGYYRVRGIVPGTTNWDIVPIERPENEPIYIHDGSVDLKADPFTVVPPWYEFVAWWTLWLVMEIAIVSICAEPALVSCFFAVWLLGPFYTWFVNVEPVRGTKVSAMILGVEAALVLRRRHDRTEAARYDAFVQRINDSVAQIGVKP